MRRFTTVFLFMLMPLSHAFAQGLETDPVLGEIQALMLATGNTVPTVSLPVARGELYRALATMDDPSVPAAPRMRAAALATELGAQTEGNRLDVRFELRPEYYLNVQRDTFSDQLTAEAPFATLAMGYGRALGPYLFIEAVLQREWAYADAPTNVPRPEEGNPAPFENNMVRQGYVYVPVGLVDVTFGRQEVSIGPLPEQSLYVSSAVPFLDALKVTIAFPRLKMTSISSTLENGRASPDTATGGSDSLYGFDLNTIVYNVHYFEYAWRRVRAGIGSQVVLARRMNSFQLGDFFPVFSWHNSDFAPNNMSLVADVSVTPIANVSLSLQLGLDDISGETFGIADAPVPTIDAYIAGISYRLPQIDGGLSLTGGYTHYLWGNYELGEYLERAIYRLEADGLRRSMPLTAPYGPGALWTDARATARWRDIEIAAGYRALGRLPGANLYTTPYESLPQLEASAREWTHRLGLEIDYRFGEVVGASVAPALTVENGEARFALTVSGRVSRSVTREGLP